MRSSLSDAARIAELEHEVEQLRHALGTATRDRLLAEGRYDRTQEKLVALERVGRELRETSATLLLRQEQARRLVEGVKGHSIFTTDALGCIVDWTSGAASVFGWTADEIIGESADILYTPEDRAAGVHARELETARREGCANDERWHVGRGGKRVFLNGSVRPLHDETGEISGFIKIARDETERRASEARLQRVLDIETVGVVFFDFVGGIQQANDAFLQMIGYTREELEAGEVRYERLTPPDWRWRDEQTIAELKATGKAGPFEKEYTRKDGSRFWILCADKRLDDHTAVEFIIDVTEQKAAGAALRASEEFNRRVLASSTDCIKVLDPGGRLEFMSEGGMCVMEVDDFGAIEGAYWPDFWQGDEHAKVLAAVEAAKRGGTGRFQGFAATLKGAPRWWDVAVTPINGVDGRPEKLLAVSRDITATKEAEERLRETSRRLDAILANTREAVFLMDHRQHCVYANAAAEKLTGYSFAEMQGRPLHDVVHHKKADGSHYPLEECPIDRAFPERAQMSGEELFVHKDGSFYPVAFTASPVLDDNGQPIGTVIEARNIAERKAREAALRESEARVQALTDNLPAGTVYQIATGRDGTERRFTYVSQSHEKLTGVPAEAVLADPSIPYNLIVPEDRGRLVEAEAEAIRTKTPFDVEARFRRADGEVRWCRILSAPREQADGSIIWDGIQIDTTEQKAVEAALRELNETLEARVTEEVQARLGAEDALRQAQKMEAVGQLTGGIAHDFNNLLTGVIGSLDMMQRRIAQGQTDRIERYTNAALTSANRAAALTHRLLAFSRRQPLDPKPVNANRLVTGMEELLRRTIGESIRLEIVTAGGLWQTLCDPHQLESAILNLAINARDAMSDGGTLTIETCNAHLDGTYAAKRRDVKPGQYVCICVTDTGTGMAKDVIEKAFDPFFTTKPIGQGTGLGLSMIYGFARQSEGYARIYSEVGQGTTVKLYLPRYYGEAEDVDEAQRVLTEEHKSEHGENVLVVEDESAVRALVVDVLEELGYRAIEATDGPSGLKILESDARVDLLVTDVGLPGLNGRQLADAARRVRPELKVLFITGYAENAAIASGFLEPGMQMITKPFAIETLATRIRDMIER